MRWTNGALIVATLIAVACKGNDNAVSRGNAQAGNPKPGRPGAATDGVVGDVSGQLREVAVAPAPAIVSQAVSDANASGPPQQAGPIANQTSDITSSAMIIRTGTATIKVDSLEPAVARLRALATSVGGYVGNTSMQTGKDQLRSATVEIKVPSQRWGQLLVGLKPIGTLEAQDESAEDVSEEYVDVEARVTNARRLEARLIDLLANRTGKLSDALSVERELARVREEIERYEGRMRYLRTRSAISTMTVTVHEPFPVLGSKPGDNPIAQAFRDAWRGFVGFIAGIIVSLGVLIPLGVIAWIVWLLYRRYRRKGK
jgi:hypothetical protein